MPSRGGRRPRAASPQPVEKGPPGYESLEEELNAGQRLAVDLAKAINEEAGATVAKARFGLDEHRVVVTLRNLGVEMTVIPTFHTSPSSREPLLLASESERGAEARESLSHHAALGREATTARRFFFQSPLRTRI